MLTLHIDPQNSAADTFVLKPAGAVDQVQVPLTTIEMEAIGVDVIQYAC